MAAGYRLRLALPIIVTTLAFSAFVASASACSPALPLPTVQQHFARATNVFMARLVEVKRIPHPRAFTRDGAIQEASFEILMVLKGSSPKSALLRLQTGFTSCRTDFTNPVEVIDGGPNPHSDVWILMRYEDDPPEVQVNDGSLPINHFTQSELRFLFSNGTRTNNALERSRER